MKGAHESDLAKSRDSIGDSVQRLTSTFFFTTKQQECFKHKRSLQIVLQNVSKTLSVRSLKTNNKKHIYITMHDEE